MFKNISETKKSRIFPAIISSVAVPFVLFITVPLDIYFNNLNEFLFGVNHFLFVNILICLLLSVLCFLLLMVLPDKIYSAARGLIAGVLLMLFVQSCFLNGNMNSLAGDGISTETVSAGIIKVNAIVWVFVPIGFCAAAVLLNGKEYSSLIFSIVCVSIMGSQLISTAVSGMTAETASRGISSTDAETGGVYNFLTTENMTSISSERNVFVFVVDRFDDSYALNALEKEPGIFDGLTGFTYFTDNISHYSHTFPSIVYMITGYEWDPGYYRDAYFRDAYSHADALEALSREGYSINIYTERFYCYFEHEALPECVSNAGTCTGMVLKSAVSAVKLPLRLDEMAMYRCFPHVLKNAFSSISSTYCNQYLVPDNSNEPYDMSNRAVKDCIDRTGFCTTDSNVFTFLHISGCHPADNETVTNNCFDAVKTSFDIINPYLDEMKRLGVYNDATIIITGDHSAPNLQRTALFVKPSGSGDEELQYSSAQVSSTQLWASIFESEGIYADSTEGIPGYFDIEEDLDTTRYLVDYTFANNSFVEYVTFSGDSHDEANRTVTGSFYTGKSDTA